VANTIRIGVQATGTAKASSDIDKLRDKFEQLQKGGAKGFAIGAGAVVAGAAIAALGIAVSKAGEFIGDATQAALEEEVSIQKLGTALRANVKDWDGNTAAIEDVLKSRMRLGFSDDEQRESLAILVARTGDVTKALDIQRAAMDLARLKGIGLAEASKAISMGMSGSGRALKELGINVKDYSSAQEILTAIQRKAAGQAEDYAKTNAGKLLVSQVKVGEAMERFGAVTMPVVVTVMSTAADVVTTFASALDNAASFANDLNVATGGTAWSTANLRDRVIEAGKASLAHADALGQYTYSQHEANAAAATGAARYGLLGDSIMGLGGKAGAGFGTMASRAQDGTEATADSFDTMTGRIKTAAQDMIDQAFAPVIANDKLMAANAEVSSARRIIASSTATKAEKADARERLASLLQGQTEALLVMASLGQTDAKSYKDGMKALDKAINESSGDIKAALIEARRQIRMTATAAESVGVVVTMTYGHGKAEGGPVAAGSPYIVGEKGPEMFVPKSAGTIIPNDAMTSGGSSRIGGGSITINFTTMFAPTAAQAQIAARAIIPELTREMRRQSIL
jgi:hypothetical protein